LCVLKDMQQMESQMQQVQRRRDETRDPLLNQLRALMETIQRREQSHEPVHERLTGAVEALKLTNAQMASNTGDLEAKLLKKINGLVSDLKIYCFLILKLHTYCCGVISFPIVKWVSNNELICIPFCFSTVFFLHQSLMGGLA
jgi:hypothetical protein